MRRLVFSLLTLTLCTSLAAVAEAQKGAKASPAPKSTPRASATPAASASSEKSTAPSARPQFRPSVLGVGPSSLVNRIDSEALLKAGQKDGAVMFAAMVGKDGVPKSTWTYRAMPGSTALEAELNRQLDETKFTPALYEHQPVEVMLYGTVVFSAEGTPHVHIFLNQDGDEIKQASDFIGPQPVVGADSKFNGLKMPALENPIAMTAVVDLRLKVDAKGNLTGLDLVSEEPPLLGFAEAARQDLAGAKFIPAFRNGDPADSETTLPLAYKIVPEPAAPPEQ